MLKLSEHDVSHIIGCCSVTQILEGLGVVVGLILESSSCGTSAK